MRIKTGLSICVTLIAFVMLAVPVGAQAEQAESKFTVEQLDQMLAPIALYPDDVLSNVLVGSTYPLEVVQAARWRKEPANAKLKGEALEKALADKEWDPSIKALVLFPDVLQTMSEKLDWTQKLGDAFLAQQDEVMNEIQVLRGKADQAGNLTTNEKQKVTKESGSGSTPVYVIESANPDVVYVPTYQTTEVYGSWWYPDYPPYAWRYPGASFVNGFFWGAGIGIASSIWRWGQFDWRNHDIDIDIDRYNRINVDRNQITSNKWVHDAAHRGKVPYRGKEVREKFGKGDKLSEARKDFRGFDENKVGDGLAGAKDRLPDRSADKVKERLGEGGGQKIKDRASGGTGKAKEKIADRAPGKSPSKAVSQRNASKAMDVKKRSDVAKHVNRGQASRNSAGRHAAAHHSVNRGGGGHRGGGHRGGGGRRR